MPQLKELSSCVQGNVTIFANVSAELNFVWWGGGGGIPRDCVRLPCTDSQLHTL